MQNKVAAVLLVCALVAGAAGSYLLSNAYQAKQTTTESHGTKLLFMEVGGVLYNALEVSDVLVFNAHGYSYFTNGSVAFMGVNFTTICPATTIGCPAENGVTQTVTPASTVSIRMAVRFPDDVTETLSEGFGSQGYSPVVSRHVNPQAGLIVEYIRGTKSYRAFVLVTTYGSEGI